MRAAESDSDASAADVDCRLRGWALACASFFESGSISRRCRRLNVERVPGNRWRRHERRRGGPGPKIPEDGQVETDAQRAAGEKRTGAQRRHCIQYISGRHARSVSAPRRVGADREIKRLAPFRASTGMR